MRPLVSGLRPTFPPARPFQLRSLRCWHCTHALETDRTGCPTCSCAVARRSAGGPRRGDNAAAGPDSTSPTTAVAFDRVAHGKCTFGCSCSGSRMNMEFHCWWWCRVRCGPARHATFSSHCKLGSGIRRDNVGICCIGSFGGFGVRVA
jgi:hypothetical protein